MSTWPTYDWHSADREGASEIAVSSSPGSPPFCSNGLRALRASGAAVLKCGRRATRGAAEAADSALDVLADVPWSSEAGPPPTAHPTTTRGRPNQRERVRMESSLSGSVGMGERPAAGAS